LGHFEVDNIASLKCFTEYLEMEFAGWAGPKVLGQLRVPVCIRVCCSVYGVVPSEKSWDRDISSVQNSMAPTDGRLQQNTKICLMLSSALVTQTHFFVYRSVFVAWACIYRWGAWNVFWKLFGLLPDPMPCWRRAKKRWDGQVIQ